MIIGDFHTHTTYCDGKNTAEEMLDRAMQMGLTHYGFSGHALTSYDVSYCMNLEETAQYCRTVNRLKEQYGDKITVLRGIEQDFYADMPAVGYDYVIGSVHCLKKGDSFLLLDESKETITDIVRDFYDGDWYAMAEDYFALVARVPELGADIVGHMDLITKFNAANDLFDETHPRYLEAAYRAVDALIPYRIPFEINTGAIYREYQTRPYPSVPILEYIGKKGGKVILSGDAHHVDGICYKFDECRKLAENMGLTIVDLPK